MIRLCALLLLLAGFAAAKQPLVIVSVDGLDNRYLANADGMGLKIPNIRRLMREGQVSAGVIGAVPTITWPSHTTIITGADPVAHGILGNWRPPGDKFLDYSQIKAPTLLGAAHAAGLKIATVDWPVTVGAPVDWNIPEYFLRRRGGAMDTKSVESKTQPPDLFARIAADNPSFTQEWMDDRTRTLAVVWILQHLKPDLLLVHLVDLDSEEHDNAPFTREAKAIVELTDDMIGQIVRAMPAGSAFALVSDHGFERVNTLVNLQTATGAQGVNSLIQMGGTVAAPDEHAAAVLRQLSKDAKYGIEPGNTERRTGEVSRQYAGCGGCLRSGGRLQVLAARRGVFEGRGNRQSRSLADALPGCLRGVGTRNQGRPAAGDVHEGRSGQVRKNHRR